MKPSSNKAARLLPPARVLLGAGPSNSDPQVQLAMAQPLVGHMDPYFIHAVNEIKAMLQHIWHTANEFTVPVSGTGTAAMEAALCNVVEDGDVVLVFVNGYFAQRMATIATRFGGQVVKIEGKWGTAFEVERVKQEIEKHKPKVVAMVHAETSTGVCQPKIAEIGEICRKNNSIFVLDTVTSIAGVPLYIDDWKVDVAYAGAQKCIACPPGASPLTMNERALEKVRKRKAPVESFYFDALLLSQYLVGTGENNSTRVYHHTAPIANFWAFHEALRLVLEEGIENRWARHERIAKLLYKELDTLGLKCLVTNEEHRLSPLTTVILPEGVDGKELTKLLLTNYNIEVSGGLGELAGKIIRIGLMGYNARLEIVTLLIAALRDTLKSIKK